MLASQTSLPPNQPSGISLAGVSLTRGNTLVFKDLSLDLHERRIGLIGHNGAGKSSLFRLICGLDTPSAGHVHVPPSNSDAHVVGMMFQNSDEQIIFPTVAEELALSLQHLNISRTQALAQAQQWLDAQGLGQWGARAIGALSQGQRQRVCWWSLMLGDHQTLLLDEPFASLDLPNQIRLNQDMDQATPQIIVSTHQLDHVRHYERVIWLDQGQVRADGLGAHVCQTYEAHVREQLNA
jgi:biotin transport system ATP-binding protein